MAKRFPKGSSSLEHGCHYKPRDVDTGATVRNRRGSIAVLVTPVVDLPTLTTGNDVDIGGTVQNRRGSIADLVTPMVDFAHLDKRK